MYLIITKNQSHFVQFYKSRSGVADGGVNKRDPRSDRCVKEERRVPLVIEDTLTLDDVIEVSRHFEPVRLSHAARERVTASRRFLEKILSEGEVPYGVRTGFGKNANVVVSLDVAARLSYQLTRGLGVAPCYQDCFSTEVTRAAVLCRVNSLAQGYSGIKIEILETMIDLLNKRVHPRIPIRGSVGASGDLIPLSYITRVLIGEGEAEYEGQVIPSAEALAKASIQPVRLEPKEGLAIVNGTSLMTGIAIQALNSANDLVLLGEALTAMCNEVMRGTLEPFDPRIHRVKPHPGQIQSAANILVFSEGSSLLTSHNELRSYLKSQSAKAEIQKTEHRAQTLYAIRCAPQVYGGIRDFLDHVERTILVELNSVTDNPLLFSEDNDYLQGGNFQGYHVSLAMDVLRNGLSSLAKFQEQQFGMIMDPGTNGDLPAGLVEDRGDLNMGFQGMEVAETSLLPYIDMLANPISNKSSPTDRPNQNFVSMGTVSARAALNLIKETELISTNLMVLLAQAAYLRGPEKLSRASRIIYDEVRRYSPPVERDRYLDEEVNHVNQDLVRNGALAGMLKQQSAMVQYERPGTLN